MVDPVQTDFSSSRARTQFADSVATHARQTALATLAGKTEVEVLIFDRQGRLAGRSHG